MHTFDDAKRGPQVPTLEELAKADIPDIHEVGETNEYWLYVKRSTGMLEIVSKHNGEVIAKCRPDADAKNYGISDAQIAAAQGVLRIHHAEDQSNS